MRKTASNGAEIEFRAVCNDDAYGVEIEVRMDGKPQGAARLGKAPAGMRIGTKVITHIVNAAHPFGLTAEEAADLQAEMAPVQAARDARRAAKQAPQWSPSPERAAISSMFDAAEDLRDYPGRYFPALGKAQNALQAWREAHPEEAAAEDAHHAAVKAEDKARREQEYKTSFIGRGLD